MYLAMKAAYLVYHSAAKSEVSIKFWDWFVVRKFMSRRYAEVSEEYGTVHLYLTGEYLWLMYNVLSVGRYVCPYCGRG